MKAASTTIVRGPVLVVPGWSDAERVLRPLARYLAAQGWPPAHVRALGFRRRFGGNVEHAREIAAAVEELRAASGATSVAVVAHSMGGLALRWYLARLGGAPRVHTAVFLATPHRGTYAAWLAFGAGGREMRPGSAFLRELNATTWPAGVRAHCLRTPFDLRVFPHASALLEGAATQVIRAPTHPGMLRSRKVFEAVRAILEDGSAAA